MSDNLTKSVGTMIWVVAQSGRTISALILREVSTTYGRSPGGYVWAVAEPLAGIALLAILFSLGFQAPPLGTSFALFYASGLVPFLVYADINGKLSQAINFSRPLLSYPRVALIDALLARACLNTLTQTVIFSIVFIGLLAVVDRQSEVDMKEMIFAHMLALSLGVGVGSLNCFLTTLYPVWQRVWSIANRPMFLLSCVVFTFETIPAPFSDVLWWNPIVHIIGLMRRSLYFGYDAPYVSISYVLFFSMIACTLGLFLLWRFKDRLLNF